MTENYYEKLKDIKEGNNKVVEAEVVGEEKKVESRTTEDAKAFYEGVFEGQGQPGSQGPQPDDFQKQQYVAQVKFVLQKRFNSLSLLLGIFGLTMIIVSIIALLNNLTDEIMTEALEGIDWEVTAENINLMRSTYYFIHGTQIAIALVMLYAAYLAKLGQYKALKLANIATMICIVIAAFNFELLNIVILILIYMNIRTTKSFIDTNVNNMQ